MGIIEIAGSVLSRAEQRVEVSAQNIANMTTPGYKARRAFSNVLAASRAGQIGQQNVSAESVSLTDFTAGKMTNTGNPLDLAISGSGFFVVRSDNAIFYTRDGQFSRNAEGRLVTSGGLVLQSVTGDITVGGADVTILSDGTVLEARQSVARLSIADERRVQEHVLECL